MQDHTATLQVGQPAPEFSLSAANRPGMFTLSASLAHGPLVVEFLRGTW
jgi:peroxiredoxin